MMIERVDTKGKRRYRSARPAPPIASLVPTAVDLLRSTFQTTDEAPSVTSVLGALAKPALIGWAAREERKMVVTYAAHLYRELSETAGSPIDVPTFITLLGDRLGQGAHLRLLTKAATVGTEVHARIEWEFKGELSLDRPTQPPALTSDQAERSFRRWTEWRQSVQLQPIALERTVYSALFGYGGTLDLLAKVADQRLVVIDFKTGRAIYPEAFLQNVAYRLALREEGIETHGGWIVRLPKVADDPEFDAKPVPNDPTLEPTWLALLVVYRWWDRTRGNTHAD